MSSERPRALCRCSVGRPQRECSVSWGGIATGAWMESQERPLFQVKASGTCVTGPGISLRYNRMSPPVSSESRPIEDEKVPAAYNPE
jgi:hypothetical protein